MEHPFFKDIGFESMGLWHLTPPEALEACRKGAVLIDVRENYHSFLHTFDVEHLFYCPLSELPEYFERIPADTPVIIADAAGLKSKEAVLILQKKGFLNMANLAGGMLEWNREALPVKSDKTQRLSGSCMCMLKYREIGRKL